MMGMGVPLALYSVLAGMYAALSLRRGFAITKWFAGASDAESESLLAAAALEVEAEFQFYMGMMFAILPWMIAVGTSDRVQAQRIGDTLLVVALLGSVFVLSAWIRALAENRVVAARIGVSRGEIHSHPPWSDAVLFAGQGILLTALALSGRTGLLSSAWCIAAALVSGLLSVAVWAALGGPRRLSAFRGM